MKKPTLLAVTLGDPNGIGPEVALKTVYKKRWPRKVRFVLIGSARLLAEQAERFGFPAPPPWAPGSDGPPAHKVSVWDPDPSRRLPWRPGKPLASAGAASAEWIAAGVSGCLNGWWHGLVTAPISKQGFKMAGITFPGHTEMLARLTKTKRFAMMLLGRSLRVVLVTRHIPLAEVPSALTRKDVRDAIRMTGEGLTWLGVRRKRIGVCGLNPHAGEKGTLGREEINVIAPAVRACARARLDVAGPIPADTIFHRAINGDFDAVVAMYHDQGLGPLKMLAFDEGVNLTLGLPIVRTSPHHATAYALAGKGAANSASMTEAVKLALQLAGKKNPWR